MPAIQVSSYEPPVFSRAKALFPFLSAAGLLVCLVLAALCALTPARTTFDYPLEVITAQRILNHERPYVDFKVSYGPLGHYFTAGAAWVFANVPPATASNLFFAICCALYFLVAGEHLRRRAGDRKVLLLGYIGILILSAPVIGSYSYYSLLPLLCVVMTFPLLDSVVPALPKAPPRWLPAAGVGFLSAAALLIRFNFGVYLIAALAITAVLAVIVRQNRTALPIFRCILLTGAFLGILVGVFWPSGIAAAYLRDLPSFVTQSVAARAMPLRLAPAKPLLMMMAVSAGFIALRATTLLVRRQIDARIARCGIVLAFFIYSLYRFDVEHAGPYLALVPLALCDFDRDRESPGFWSSVRAVSGVAVALLLVLSNCFLLLGREGYVRATLDYWILRSPEGVRAALARAARTVPPEPRVLREGMLLTRSESEMVDRLESLRKPNENVFWASAPGSCESTFHHCVNLALYLAMKRLPTPAVWSFDPAFTASAETQEGIAQDLERDKTPWVGIEGLLADDAPLPGAVREATRLQEYVREKYDEVFTTRMPELNRYYVVYSRKRPSESELR